ncbi:MAG: segregation/condensation protein A [Acidimicrobiaceae bacterium]|nr:segregation/condensation protein A [Acidimicrobiaceae bacterium]
MISQTLTAAALDDAGADGSQGVLDCSRAVLVSVPGYSGPFEMLLQLILRQKMDIYDVSVADITCAFLAEVEQLPECDLETATEFLLIAATLLEIKARRLLPSESVVELDEEFEAVSERDLLLKRLLECSTFRDASRRLRQLFEQAARSRPRTAGVGEERWLLLAPNALARISPADLRGAFWRACAPRPEPRVDIAHITPISLTVGDAVAELIEELTRCRRATFRRLTDGIDDRVELVVRFLAVLELFKQGLADVEQAVTFGDIVISWTGGDGAEARAAAVAGVDVYEG